MNGVYFRPGYISLHRSGELKKRGEALWGLLGACSLCPRECGVDRISGEKGFCQAGSKLKVASFFAHFGEERPLVGVGGSFEAMKWISAYLPLNTYVNIMIQYRPAYRAHLFPEIDHPVKREVYQAVVREARVLGLVNLDVDL